MGLPAILLQLSDLYYKSTEGKESPALAEEVQGWTLFKKNKVRTTKSFKNEAVTNPKIIALQLHFAKHSTEALATRSHLVTCENISFDSQDSTFFICNLTAFTWA